MTDRFDVVAINLTTNKVRLMAEDKSERNAEAIVDMAAMRRGVDEEFFSEVPAGTYQEGDEWNGQPE